MSNTDRGAEFARAVTLGARAAADDPTTCEHGSRDPDLDGCCESTDHPPGTEAQYATGGYVGKGGPVPASEFDRCHPTPPGTEAQLSMKMKQALYETGWDMERKFRLFREVAQAVTDGARGANGQCPSTCSEGHTFELPCVLAPSNPAPDLARGGHEPSELGASTDAASEPPSDLARDDDGRPRRYADSIAAELRRLHYHSAADQVLSLADGFDLVQAERDRLRSELADMRAQRDALQARIESALREFDEHVGALVSIRSKLSEGLPLPPADDSSKAKGCDCGFCQDGSGYHYQQEQPTTFTANSKPADDSSEAGGLVSLADVQAERARQVASEGWTPEHDDQHTHHELVSAALTYLTGCSGLWPWSNTPKFGQRDGIKAGALLLAEMGRQQRADSKEPATSVHSDAENESPPFKPGGYTPQRGELVTGWNAHPGHHITGRYLYSEDTFAYLDCGGDFRTVDDDSLRPDVGSSDA